MTEKHAPVGCQGMLNQVCALLGICLDFSSFLFIFFFFVFWIFCVFVFVGDYILLVSHIARDAGDIVDKYIG